MNKLLSATSAIAIVVAGTVANASEILTNESLDIVTAGLTVDLFSVSTNTYSSTASRIDLSGMTLVSQCSGSNCTITLRTGSSLGNTNVCSPCTLMINQSGITVTDKSGHIWYADTARLQANPQQYRVITFQ